MRGNEGRPASFSILGEKLIMVRDLRGKVIVGRLLETR